MTKRPSEAHLIYNWNLKGRRAALVPTVEFFDETLRDGIQGPSISDPSIEIKLKILELEESLGLAQGSLAGAGVCHLGCDDALRSPDFLRRLSHSTSLAAASDKAHFGCFCITLTGAAEARKANAERPGRQPTSCATQGLHWN